MPEPMAICIEDLEPVSGSPRFVRCVAMAGGLPGLRMSFDGSLSWMTEQAAACELWVSGDERLILLRPQDAPPVRVTRAGRSIDAPMSKPVVLVHGDEITIGARSFRVHIHGKAPSVHAPSPLVEPTWGVAAKVAAVVAMGAAVVGCKPVEVRDNPPKVTALPEPAEGNDAASGAPPDAPVATLPEAAPSGPIEVREAPPIVVPIASTPPKPPPSAKPAK
ncbi:MAG: hypothetical protein HY898_23490 [Deltaproteobacteria bacterium]|nr:hypothetical protein [Deltaproteobacteria bacterium]